DGRLWRTLGLLLFRPGRLTHEYIAGRRIRYIRPLRIYFSATILFFFLISVLDPAERMRQALDSENAALDTLITVEQRQGAIADLIQSDQARLAGSENLVDSLVSRYDSVEARFTADSLAGSLSDSLMTEQSELLDDLGREIEDKNEDLQSLRTENAVREQRFEWQLSVLEEYPPDSLIRRRDLIEEAELRFPDAGDNNNVNIGLPEWIPRSSAARNLSEAQTNEETTAALAELGRNTIERIPLVMFLLLPLFALLMKVLFVRRDWYYTEHLVFALHTHAFAFIIFTLFVAAYGFAFIPDYVSWIVSALTLLIPLYFYIAMKRVYKQGWIKTALKMCVIGFAYMLAIFAGLTLAIVLAAIG
ncbi:MAG: DUF3667 domain-containing protein, partial [Rubricoccaceae bacterium]|nr:DUF3667 domain-containing protein [Rubricoccaceae bacterium]